MTFKNWRVLYALILFALLFIVLIVDFHIKEYAAAYFVFWPKVLFISLILPVVGMLFGLQSLMQYFKREGKWKINLGKVLIISLPAFICANYMLVFWGRFEILYLIQKYLVVSESAIHIFQLLFGYSFITSFYKEKAVPQLSEHTHNRKVNHHENRAHHLVRSSTNVSIIM